MPAQMLPVCRQVVLGSEARRHRLPALAYRVPFVRPPHGCAARPTCRVLHHTDPNIPTVATERPRSTGCHHAHACRGSAEAAEATSLAHAAIGASIAAQGPRAVLAVVPVDVTNLATCDTWIIPLLRKHAGGTEMAVWGEYMLPRARMVGSLAARAHHLGAPSRLTPPVHDCAAPVRVSWLAASWLNVAAGADGCMHVRM